MSGRFTTVEEDQRRSAELARESEQSPAIIQIVLLAVSILMIVGLLFYFMRPPSAAKLYARIEAAANDPEPNALRMAEEDVQSFLTRFPNDEHAADVKRYQDEINLQRLEQRFRLRVRSLSNDALSPVEHDYLEAMNNVGVDPEQTIEKLQALVELYGALPDQIGSHVSMCRTGAARVATIASASGENRAAISGGDRCQPEARRATSRKFARTSTGNLAKYCDLIRR